MDTSTKIHNFCSTKQITIDFYVSDNILYPIDDTLINNLTDISLFKKQKHIGKYIYYNSIKDKLYVFKYCMRLDICPIIVDNKLLNVYGLRIGTNNFFIKRIINNSLSFYLSALLNNNSYDSKTKKCFVNTIASLHGHISPNDITMLHLARNIYRSHKIKLFTSNREIEINTIIGKIINKVNKFADHINNFTVDTKIVDNYVYKINTLIDKVGSLSKIYNCNRKLIFNTFVKVQVNNLNLCDFIQRIII